VLAIRFCLNIYRFLLGQRGVSEPPGDGKQCTVDGFVGARGGNLQWQPIIEIVKIKGVEFMTFPVAQ